MLNTYEQQVLAEVAAWQDAMRKPPSKVNNATKTVQRNINKIIPEKVHKVITGAIKQMVRGVLFGADITTFKPKDIKSFEATEVKVKEKINIYCSTASAEGAITGFGGFISGMADFPIWLTIKMKMLYEVANLYDIDIKDYKERLFILNIFQLAFSSQAHRNEVFKLVSDWNRRKELLPDDIHQFDWRTFQLEYREYIDLAKLLQLVPGLGAVVGAYVNHKLTDKLGKTAMNAYRLRRLSGDTPYVKLIKSKTA
ncbi:MAG: EcsC family protein [Bacteroidota bacterium]